MARTVSHNTIVKKILPIVYQDETICIINKPYGLPVQGGAHVSACLTSLLEQQLNTKIYPVHRLDKDTTGLLVSAKTAAAAHSCRLLFDSKAVKKEYLAVCFRSSPKAGYPAESSSGTIRVPITENGTPKQAATSYRILAETEHYCCFSLQLHTGRMHQIRIHLAGMGFPIIGDDKHGDFRLNKALWKNARIKKLQLCAYRLEFPISGKKQLFTVPLPEHISSAAAALLNTNKLFSS